MIESIERNGTKVVIRINTGLEGIEKRILSFDWEAGYEIYAELLKEHLWVELDKFKHKIALEPHYYLEPEEISKLKSKLVHEWNGNRHCWK